MCVIYSYKSRSNENESRFLDIIIKCNLKIVNHRNVTLKSNDGSCCPYKIADAVLRRKKQR